MPSMYSRPCSSNTRTPSPRTITSGPSCSSWRSCVYGCRWCVRSRRPAAEIPDEDVIAHAGRVWTISSGEGEQGSPGVGTRRGPRLGHARRPSRPRRGPGAGSPRVCAVLGRCGGAANDLRRRTRDDHGLRIEIRMGAAVDAYAEQAPGQRRPKLDACRHTGSDVKSKGMLVEGARGEAQGAVESGHLL